MLAVYSWLIMTVIAEPPRGIVGVVRTTRSDHARTLAHGWLRAGVPGVEVTTTVPDTASLIGSLASRYGVRVGVGTVLDPRTVETFVAAGAAYVLAPNTDLAVVAEARRLGVPAVPGALTPTEIAYAVRLGASAVKVFPVGALGGVAYLRSVLEPMPTLRLVASGGIAVEQVAEYLACGVHAVCLGRALIDPAALEAGDADGIAEHAARVLARAGVTPAG